MVIRIIFNPPLEAYLISPWAYILIASINTEKNLDL
jgi:hypothetical protein